MQLASFFFVLSVLLTPPPAADCLQVSPDRSQFFQYDSVSLSCSDRLNSTGWKVRRRTPVGGVRPCSSGWGSTSSGFTCVIRVAYPMDSGVYWCESPDGRHSNRVNITITDGSLILEVPARPVSEGAAVTLRCRAKNSSSHRVFSFHKDGRPIGSSSTGEMSIGDASEADEGLYKCGVAGGAESAGSWLAVEAPAEPARPTRPTASSRPSVSRILCHLVVGAPYLLSTVLLALIYRDRNRDARRAAERTSDHGVVVEIVA